MKIYCDYQGLIEVSNDFECGYCDECDFCTDKMSIEDNEEDNTY